jgi:long-chain acyl-CoA synthetase
MLMEKYKSLTLKEVIKYSREKFAKLDSLSFVNGVPLSYEELGIEIDKIQYLLQQNGISKGDKVAILSGNMPNWGIAYYAITSMGAVAVPILPDFHEDEVRNILTHSESKAIFISERLFSKIQNIELETLSVKVLINDFSVFQGNSIKNRLTPKYPENLEIQDIEVNEEDIASIIYTSGTTGKSKGVMLSHKNLTFDADKCATVQPIKEKDVFLSILPLSHTYENTLGLVLPIMFGASVYYLEKPPTSSVLLPALAKIRPTIMLSVPIVIEKIYRNKILPQFTKSKITNSLYNFPPTRKLLNKVAGKKLMKTFGDRLIFFGVGGAKLDAVVEKFLLEANFPYAIGYGLTETAPMLAGSNPSQVRHQAIGPVMDGVQIRIDKPDPETGEGEIVAKGDNVMMGYYKEPKITEEVFTKDGWFKTGDLGYFDKDGYLFIKGRIKNMIIGPSGENIYPEEIESVINNFNYVVESVVVEKKGKIVAMVHFNMEELEKQFKHLKIEAKHYREEVKKHADEKIEELTKELHKYVNSKVNKFSQVHILVPQLVPFEKTPTMKIKRYLYTI